MPISARRAWRLLCRILEDVATLPEFRRSATVGLPQENFDCSRVLAHTHLRTVDDEFANEGSKNRFSRYMDDVVIGADSEKEALQFVHRIQRSMERIGLYPNTAKTRITTAAQFRQELMKPENDELGELELEVFSRPAFVRRMTADLLSAHLSLRPRPKAWERVLRRWYSLCRTARDPALLGVALRHLAAFPGSAPHILDYMSVFPLDANRLRNLFERVDSFGGVYENIEILAQEFVCQAAGSELDEISRPCLRDCSGSHTRRGIRMGVGRCVRNRREVWTSGSPAGAPHDGPTRC